MSRRAGSRAMASGGCARSDRRSSMTVSRTGTTANGMSPSASDTFDAVGTSYSARHAAELIGLPESAVRSCIRDGLVGTPGTVPAQLSFRDLSALRTVKALVDAGMPLPRVRKELARIQQNLPAGTSLAELTVEARGGAIHVRGANGDAPL